MAKILFTFDWGEEFTLKFQLSPFNLQPTSDYTVIRFVIHVLFCNPFPYYFKIQYNIHGLFICCCTTDRSWERNSFITLFCNSLYMTSSSLSLNLLLLSSSWYVAFFDRVTFPLKNFTVNKKFSKSEHGPYFSLHKSHKKNCDATRIGKLGFNRITLKLLVSFKIEILTVLLSSAILNYVALFIWYSTVSAFSENVDPRNLTTSSRFWKKLPFSTHARLLFLGLHQNYQHHLFHVMF